MPDMTQGCDGRPLCASPEAESHGERDDVSLSRLTAVQNHTNPSALSLKSLASMKSETCKKNDNKDAL